MRRHGRRRWISPWERNETGAPILTTEPPETAYTNEYVEKALAELEEEGVDTKGADYEPVEVALAEGGN